MLFLPQDCFYGLLFIVAAGLAARKLEQAKNRHTVLLVAATCLIGMALGFSVNVGSRAAEPEHPNFRHGHRHWRGRLC